MCFWNWTNNLINNSFFRIMHKKSSGFLFAPEKKLEEASIFIFHLNKAKTACIYNSKSHKINSKGNCLKMHFGIVQEVLYPRQKIEQEDSCLFKESSFVWDYTHTHTLLCFLRQFCSASRVRRATLLLPFGHTVRTQWAVIHHNF